MNKKLAIAVSLGLVSAMCISGTTAYLTKEVEKPNVMTTRNVDIKQLEYERKGQNNELKTFTQNEPIYPAVGTGVLGENKTFTVKEDGDENNLTVNATLYNDSLMNVRDKMVFVKNTGTSAAYYRTIIAIECPQDMESLIHLNFNENKEVVDVKRVGITKIDSLDYVLYEAIYKEALEGGQVSEASLLQVYLDSSATNEHVAKFGNEFEIRVKSQAVQANGFSSAEEALDEAFADITTHKNPWVNVESVAVKEATKMQDALTEGKDVVMTSDITGKAEESNKEGNTLISQRKGGIIDGGGNTLTATNANSTWDSTIHTEGGIIKNLNIRGGFRGIFVNQATEDTIIDNVNITAGYAINVNEGWNKSIIVKNSILNGWTSVGDDTKSAEFTNCYFGIGTTTSLLRPYCNTTITNCDFDVKNGYTILPDKLEDGEKVTLIDCTINGVEITEENINSLLYEGNEKYRENVVIK